MAQEPLKVGDTVYRLNDNKVPIQATKIVRTTKTKAIDEKGSEFDITPNSLGDVKLNGRMDWIRIYYNIETPEIKAQYIDYWKRRKSERYIQSILSPTHIKELSTDKLMEMAASIEAILKA